MDLFLSFLPVIVIVILCILGFLVIHKNPKGKINSIFLLLVFSSILWILLNFFIDVSGSLKYALFLSQLTIIGPVLWAPLVLYFSLIFPHEQKRYSWKNIFFIFSPPLIILCFVPTKYNVIRVWREPWGINFQPGILYGILVFYLALYFGFTLRNLVMYYIRNKGIKRAQILYILCGFLFTLILGIVMNAILPLVGHSQLVSVGPSLSLILFAGFTSYAIIRHRFLDIRIAIKQGTVYIFSVATTLALAFLLIIGINYFTNFPFNYYLLAIGLIFSLVVFEPTKKIFQKFANKYLFTSLYNYQATISALSQELIATIELDKIIGYITQITQDTMKLDRMAILLLKDKKNHHYNIQKMIGFSSRNGLTSQIFPLVIKYIEEFPEPLVYEELNHPIFKERIDLDHLTKLKEFFKEEQISICLPLMHKEKIFGLIILGNKISGDAYSSQDIALLEVLVNQASIAIENALLYQEVREFTLHLQEKVDEQTRDIKELFAVKNKFLHLVSHQLRTPLTALKGYIELWNENDYESMPLEEKKKIKKNITLSCQRLSETTNTMLDTLNLDGARINFNFQPFNLIKNIEETIEIFKDGFTKKGLELKFIKPEQPIPLIKADPKYLPQVIQNLIDNALKYTITGGLTVQVSLIGKTKVKILFKDTGIGLTPEEQKMIFKEKFFRGEDAVRQYTSGTGLGLYLVQKIIERHKGKIEIYSEGRNQGTEFSLVLPIQQRTKQP